MKRIKRGVALLLICFLFCSCGNTNNNNPAAEGAAQPATETASSGEEQKTAESSAEASDTVSANGYTVKIVAVHKTADSNGEPIAAMEFRLASWPTNQPIKSGPVSILSVELGKLANKSTDKIGLCLNPIGRANQVAPQTNR